MVLPRKHPVMKDGSSGPDMKEEKHVFSPFSSCSTVDEYC